MDNPLIGIGFIAGGIAGVVIGILVVYLLVKFFDSCDKHTKEEQDKYAERHRKRVVGEVMAGLNSIHDLRGITPTAKDKEVMATDEILNFLKCLGYTQIAQLYVKAFREEEQE